MQQANKLRISEFFSITTQLAIDAAHIIKQVFDSKDLGKQMKDIDDPMTIADVKAQTIIIKGLKKFWPSLRIIGEESQVYEGPLSIDHLNPNLFPEALFSKAKNNIDIPTELEINERLVVWVDPLDGTLSYVNNELEAVTTLIGLSVDREPVVGIIGQPYSDTRDAQGNHVFNPHVYFGNAEQKKIFYVSEESLKKSPIPFELQKPDLNGKQNYVISTSKHRTRQEILDKINTLNPEKIMQIGGSGKKCLQVLLGQSDVFLYINNKTKRWDTCPGDALLRCFGGSIYGMKGENYNYNPDEIPPGTEFANENGVLASLITGETLTSIVQKTKGFL